MWQSTPPLSGLQSCQNRQHCLRFTFKNTTAKEIIASKKWLKIETGIFSASGNMQQRASQIYENTLFVPFSLSLSPPPPPPSLKSHITNLAFTACIKLLIVICDSWYALSKNLKPTSRRSSNSLICHERNHRLLVSYHFI